jgi:hypothetical protein
LPGLPGGIILKTKNPDLGQLLEGLAMEDVGMYVHSMAIRYNLWPFGIFRPFDIFHSHWYICWQFGIFFPV